MWAGLPCELEVFNLFSGLIPQAGLARMDKQRQRQAMVPDMKISLTMGGVTSPVLHELKVIISNQTRYKPSLKERGVDWEGCEEAKDGEIIACDGEARAVGGAERYIYGFKSG